jgi:hypothetical protein
MKNASLVSLAFVLWCSCVACGAQIGDIALQGCSAAEHGRSDRAAVTAFMNKIFDSEGMGGLSPLELMEFRWVDLAADGRCELVFTRWGAAVTAINIEWQDSSQAIAGDAILVTRDLSRDWQKKIFKSSIRDMDGDGKKEIIVSSYLDPEGRLGADAAWPQVYRLQGEKYVPASKDFPEFYDREILPDLDKEIAETPQAEETRVAALEMARDKIQRVLGRDPNAGLGKAQQWATSRNLEIIGYARDVFLDIGGHEAEANAAKQAWKQALQRQREAAQ